jgi:ribosome assembly protein 1
LRLTDAALLVVDTVEGVSSQTFRVLHQLYTEKLPAILVLNKIDKLVTHCKMDPMQAFLHLNQTIEQVNAILGSFIAKEVGTMKMTEQLEGESIDTLESHFYFST